MLLDSGSFTDPDPVSQLMKDEILAEIDEKILIDPSVAKDLVEAVAPFA